VRPKDLETKRRLINADRYGDAKLSGEEALKDQQGTIFRPWNIHRSRETRINVLFMKVFKTCYFFQFAQS
jgi:hypothetical protein